ncbi:MAG: hypothetical protein ABL974_16750, partial [Prosthecobacter sp.]
TLTIPQGAWNVSGLTISGNLRIDGVLTLWGNLTINSGSLTLNNGTIKGGTVTATGSATLSVPVSTSGTLDGVTLGSDFTVSSGASLYVKNGLTLSGGAKLNMNGTNASTYIYFQGTQTLGGTGEVVFAGNGNNNNIYALGGGSFVTAAALTIGPNITVHGTQNGTLQKYYSQDSVINLGTINADTAARSIAITGLFTNQGTVSATAGTIQLSGEWSSAGTLGLSGTGTLNLGGTVTTANLGTLNRVAGTLNVTGVLDNTGATLALNAASGSWNLLNGTIKGGTITMTGGVTLSLPNSVSGTLDGVTLANDFTVGSGGTLNVKNGLTLSGGTKVNMNGTNASTYIYFQGTQTLGGTGEVVFAGNGNNNNVYALGGGSLATAAVLTIGPNITVHGTQNGNLQNYYSQDSIINQGTISADTALKTITITGPFTNQGTISATAGTLILNGTNWNGSAGTLALSGTGVLNLGGTFTTANLGTLNRTGGTLNVTGVLDNTGTTLALNAASGSWNLLNGTIKGGTITMAGGVTLSLPTSASGTLDGVTLANDFSIGSGGTLNVKNGLTVSGGAKLTMNGTNASTYIYFQGTQTLGGIGEIVFGGNGNNNVYAIGGGNLATAAVLTLGPNITVHGTQNGNLQNYYAQDSVINQGTISADTALKTITITGPFTNQGTISATAGTLLLNGANWNGSAGTLALSGSGTFHLGGTVTTANLGTLNRTGGTLNIAGVLDNTGTTLALNAASGSWNLSNGTIKGGTITTTGGATLALPVSTTGTLDGVTLANDFTISSGATLNVKNGLTLSGGAKLNINGTNAGTYVYFQGTQTLDGTGEVVFGGNGNNNNVYSIGGGSLATAAALTLGPNITVHGTQNGNLLNYYTHDSIINQGTITADTAAKTITISGNFTNQGTALAPAGTLTINGTWGNTGAINASGTGILNLGNAANGWSNAGTITTTNVIVNLGGAFTLANLGTFNRTGGTVNLTGALDNTGATLALNATTGSWNLSGGTIKGGTITMTGGATLALPASTSGTLDGVTLGNDFTVGSGGTLNVKNGLTLSAGAKINVNGTNAGTYVYFQGTQTLGGTGEIVFGGNGNNNNVYSIGGGTLATASVLTIGPNITVHGTQNGNLLNYYTQDSVINQGTISADTAAKTIVIGGNFTNQGTVSAPAGTLTINGTWSSSGAINASGTGILNLGNAANGWSNAGTITTTNVIINLGGAFTLANLGTFNRTGGTVNLTGALDNTGTTLALNATTGSWNLSGGTIKGGTITMTGGATLSIPVSTSGTLDGVTLANDFTVGSGGTLNVKNGLTLSGGAKVNINGTNAGTYVYFQGTQT